MGIYIFLQSLIFSPLIAPVVVEDTTSAPDFEVFLLCYKRNCSLTFAIGSNYDNKFSCFSFTVEVLRYPLVAIVFCCNQIQCREVEFSVFLRPFEKW